MLSYLELVNFKSFSHIKLDLRDSHKIPKKMAFIYGENGSGKSNLMSALMFLRQTFITMRNQESMKQINNPEILELMSKIEEDDIRQEVMRNILKYQFFTLTNLIEDNKTIQSTKPISITIGFNLCGKNGSYTLTFDKSNVVNEELKYQISERMGTIFSISEEKRILSPTIFFDSGYKEELLDNIEKYWGKHTFMSLLFNEIKSKNQKYVQSKIRKSLFQVMNWMNHFSVLYKHGGEQVSAINYPFDFLEELEQGIIKDREDSELCAFETALNTFFTQLYSDIKCVYYQITPGNSEYKYELYVKKMLNGKLVDIPFSLESTGTQKLLDIFPFFFSAVSGETVFIDEMDSGIHDLLISCLIENLNDSIKGQFIVTTHNTLLMRELPKENVYIIQSDADGNKEVACISDYSFRTQKNHNIQNKYLEGAYEGIPYVGYLDFEEMVEDVVSHLSPDKDSRN